MKKVNNRNPSLQCSVCGQWKRLHGNDEQGNAIQRFYACCGENGEFEHVKEVCDECCKRDCPYKKEGMKSKADLSGLYITQPQPASKFYHVFDAENRSLCKKYAMLRANPEYCEPVTGKETYKKGQDCKSCFNKLAALSDKSAKAVKTVEISAS